VRERLAAWRGAARPAASLSSAFVVAAALMVVSVLLRLPVLGYAGAHDQSPFNDYVFAHFGAYTDIGSLFFRDHLGRGHQLPYFDYRLEYPVLIGAFVWLASFVNSSVGAYLLVSAIALGAFGLVAVAALGRIEGANRWLLAAAPALAFYAVLNWDLMAIALLLVAIALYEHRRDAWATAALAGAVWAKFFPVVVLPLVLVSRLAERRWRSPALIVGVFGVVSLAPSLPVALEPAGDGGFVVRRSWAAFFIYTRTRTAAGTVFEKLPLSVPTINAITGLVLVMGLAALAVVVWRGGRAAQNVLAPACAAALLWLFATSKVYSPQYALWVVAPLAVAGAPVALLIAFSLVDALIFVTIFGGFGQEGTVHDLQWVGYYARQAVTLVLFGWVALRRLRPSARAARSRRRVAAS
jgi:hypothetical protein